MKKIKILNFIMMYFIVNNLFAQTYETLSKVYIPPSATIIKTTKVRDCNDTITAGNIVKQEQIKTNGNLTYTITKIDTLKINKVYPVEKTITKEMKNFDGYANISVDEKDKSILHVNYWLNDFNDLEKGTKIKIRNRKLQCNTTYSENSKTYLLTKDTTFNLWRVDTINIKDTLLDWYLNSDLIIEVFDKKDASKIEYYLVNKYDNNADYTIKLENREFISYQKHSVEFGPITIPFKARFGYTKNNISVKEEFSADLNIGIYGGYKLGKYRVRYEGTSLKDLANISCSIGSFLSLSTITLDSLSTTAGKNPFTKDEKATIGVISPGLGLMLSIYNFQFGTFLGWDIGFGTYAASWNFNNRPWLGFGIGYNLSSFWKK